MEKPTITQFGGILPLILQSYERYLPNAFDESMTILEKVNKIQEHLNMVGNQFDGLATQWNTVVEWVMADGLNDAVNEKINSLITDGIFEGLINSLIANIEQTVSSHTTSLSEINTHLSNIDSELENQTNSLSTHETRIVNLESKTNQVSIITKGIEVLETDPTGDDLFDGRIWINKNFVPATTNTSPSVPTGLTSSAITQSGFTLNWNTSLDIEGNVVSYNVYKNGLLYQNNVSETSLVITGQSASSNATWSVSATDGSLESNQSAGLSVTMLTLTSITDVFTGSDGQSLDSSKWSVLTGAQTNNVNVGTGTGVSIQMNKARVRMNNLSASDTVWGSFRNVQPLTMSSGKKLHTSGIFSVPEDSALYYGVSISKEDNTSKPAGGGRVFSNGIELFKTTDGGLAIQKIIGGVATLVGSIISGVFPTIGTATQIDVLTNGDYLQVKKNGVEIHLTSSGLGIDLGTTPKTTYFGFLSNKITTLDATIDDVLIEVI